MAGRRRRANEYAPTQALKNASSSALTWSFWVETQHKLCVALTVHACRCRIGAE